MATSKSLFTTIFWRLFGFGLFLLTFFILNILRAYIDNRIFQILVRFLNENFGLFIIISLISFFADIFKALLFPFNLPAPIINAIGSIYFVKLMLKGTYLFEEITTKDIFAFLRTFSFIVFPLIFLIILIVGYVEIFSKFFKKGKKKKSSKSTENKSWDEIGKEIKSAIKEAISKAKNDANRKC